VDRRHIELNSINRAELVDVALLMIQPKNKHMLVSKLEYKMKSESQQHVPNQLISGGTSSAGCWLTLSQFAIFCCYNQKCLSFLKCLLLLF
jgi:hypothetical protein